MRFHPSSGLRPGFGDLELPRAAAARQKFTRACRVTIAGDAQRTSSLLAYVWAVASSRIHDSNVVSCFQFSIDPSGDLPEGIYWSREICSPHRALGTFAF